MAGPGRRGDRGPGLGRRHAPVVPGRSLGHASLRGHRHPEPGHAGGRGPGRRHGHLGPAPEGAPAADATVPDLDARRARAHPAAGTAGACPPHRPPARPAAAGGVSGIRPIERLGDHAARRSGSPLQILGWAALAAAVALCWRGHGPGSFLFEGGYFLFALGVAVVIFCVVTTQAASLSRALGNPVFRYLGKISYGTYLWHFPLFALLSAQRLHLDGYPLLAVRIAVTLVVATGSYYLVEEPIRQATDAGRSPNGGPGWSTSGAFLGVVAVTVVATLPSTAEAAGPAPGGRRPVRGPAGQGADLRRLGGLAARLRHAGQPAPEQLRRRHRQRRHRRAAACCGAPSTWPTGWPTRSAPQCNTVAPASAQWPAQWKGDLDQFHPNVVMVLAGRWEVSDRLIDGQWLHIGEPAFDADAAAVAGAGGAGGHLDRRPDGVDDVTLLRLGRAGQRPAWPRTRRPGWPSTTPWCARWRPSIRPPCRSTTSAPMCPGGVYHDLLDGVQIRDGDGVHIVPTAAAGQWLDAPLLPEVVRVGRLQMAGRQLAPVAPATSSTTGAVADGGPAGGAVAPSDPGPADPDQGEAGDGSRRGDGRRRRWLVECRAVGLLALRLAGR